MSYEILNDSGFVVQSENHFLYTPFLTYHLYFYVANVNFKLDIMLNYILCEIQIKLTTFICFYFKV